MALLERESHLTQLHHALDAAADSGRLVLISGEAGIGKSSLVEQLIDDHQPRRRMLWGACDDLFTPRPLGPLHDFARQLSGEFPALLEPPHDRAAIFNAVFHELHQPLIVVFEDIHWADEATLDLLKFLGRRMKRTRALLLATFRDDELGQRHPLRLLIGDLTRQPTTLRLALPPLSEAAVRQLTAGRDVDPVALHRQTGGNPFYVREILAEQGGGIPNSIRDAVLSRVARLSLSGRSVLEAAAVIGSRIEPWLLSQVVQAEADAVSESLKIGILHSNPNHFTFRHELVRQTILAEMALHQRLFWHRAVLDVLQVSPQTRRDVARLAHHAAGAQDGPAILKFARQAGEEAAALGMHRAASTWFDLLEPLADGLPIDEQIDLFEKSGLYNQSRDLGKSLTAFERAAELAATAGRPIDLGLAWSRMAVVHYRRGEFERCDELLAQVIELLEPFGASRAIIPAYSLLAMRHLLQGNAAAAADNADKGYQIALNRNQIEEILQAYQVVGLCAMPMNHAQGLYHLAACLKLALDHNQYRMAGTVYANLVMHQLDVFLMQETEALLIEAKGYMIEHDLDFNLNMTLAWEAVLRFYQGRWNECEIEARAVLETQPPPLARIPALVVHGRLLARQGEPAQARALLAEAGALSHKINNQQRIGVYYCAAAEAAWLAGDYEEVGRLVDEYFETAVKNQLPGFGGEIAYWSARLGRETAVYPWMVEPFVLEIEGEWRAAAAAWARLGCPYEQARALAAGDPEAQMEALTILEKLGARPLAEQVRQSLRAAGVQAIPRGPRATTQENPYGLTNRQLDVLQLLVEGLTNADIADRLHISPKTVDHHVSAVLGKMGVSSREEAGELGRPFFASYGR